MLWEEKISRVVLMLRIPVGRRFKRYTAVAIASSQKDFGMFDSMRRARVISKIHRFFRSTTPFCSGVYAHALQKIRQLVMDFSVTNSEISSLNKLVVNQVSADLSLILVNKKFSDEYFRH